MALEHGQFRENFRPISERDTPLKGIPAGFHGIALIRGVIRRKHEISDRNSGNKRPILPVFIVAQWGVLPGNCRYTVSR